MLSTHRRLITPCATKEMACKLDWTGLNHLFSAVCAPQAHVLATVLGRSEERRSQSRSGERRFEQSRPSNAAPRPKLLVWVARRTAPTRRLDPGQVRQKKCSRRHFAVKTHKTQKPEIPESPKRAMQQRAMQQRAMRPCGEPVLLLHPADRRPGCCLRSVGCSGRAGWWWSTRTRTCRRCTRLYGCSRRCAGCRGLLPRLAAVAMPLHDH